MARKDRTVGVVSARGGFELVENGVETQRLIFSKDKDWIGKNKMKKNDDYEITFLLDDLGDYRFDIHNPMLIEGSRCPYPPASPEFFIEDVGDHFLVVKNEDRNAHAYKFTLNLLDNANNRVVYDPIYDNQNGGEP